MKRKLRALMKKHDRAVDSLKIAAVRYADVMEDVDNTAQTKLSKALRSLKEKAIEYVEAAHAFATAALAKPPKRSKKGGRR